MLIVGIYLTYLSGMLTGQTGINPMEIFGILVLLVIRVSSLPCSPPSRRGGRRRLSNRGRDE